MEPIDAFDRKLLNALQVNGRLTNGELAELVHLSPSQCSRRRTNLERAGIIDRYSAILSPDKAGIGITSIIAITLSHHDENNAEHLRQLLSDLPNVQEAYALTGEMDYHIKVVSKDLDALSRFINKVLLPHKAVQNVKTSIVLDILKETTVVPLD